MNKKTNLTSKVALTIIYLFVIIFLSFGQVSAFKETIKIVASDRGELDRFGNSLDISGNFIISGSYQEAEDLNGANPVDKAGASYIYKLQGGAWKQSQKIIASDREENDKFGYAVAIDGEYAVISAYNKNIGNDHNVGVAYVFRNESNTWNEVQKLTPPNANANDKFGVSVAIEKDFIFVGSYNHDFDEKNGNEMKNAGAVYFYKNDNGNWKMEQKIVASDRKENSLFGIVCAVKDATMVVGAYNDSFDNNSANEKSKSGSAYVYNYDGKKWVQAQKLVAEDRDKDDLFGVSLDISDKYIAIGAMFEDENEKGRKTLSDAGSVYIYQLFQKNNSKEWKQSQKIVAKDRNLDDYFGYSIRINDNYLLVGAIFEDEDNTGGNYVGAAGSVYVFKLNNKSDWEQTTKLVNSDRQSFDYFGWSLGLSKDYAVIGAKSEDHDEAGNNKLSEAGSAYIFSIFE